MEIAANISRRNYDINQYVVDQEANELIVADKELFISLNKDSEFNVAGNAFLASQNVNSEFSVAQNVQSKSLYKQGMHDFYVSQFGNLSQNNNNVTLLNRASEHTLINRLQNHNNCQIPEESFQRVDKPASFKLK